MGNLGLIIAVVLSSAATYYGVTQMGLGSPANTGVVQLSPEVIAYIESKVGGGAAGGGQEAARLMARLSEMEKKLGDVDKVNQAYEALQQKNTVIESALEAFRQKSETALAGLRQQEATALRNQMAAICAGVFVKKTPEAPPAKTKGR